MAVLSTEEIIRIRSSVNIVDVISTYLPLTQKGKNFFGVCPFHDDHAPSMSVSPDKQIYKCFSCGATGNVFTFLMDYEHISFFDALEKVAEKAGIPLNIKTNSKTANKTLEPLYEIYDMSLKFYQNNINTVHGKEAKEYLKKREIDENIIKEFGIGLALEKRDILTKLLVEKKYQPKDLLRTGLVVKNEYGYSDIYHNRIMFPLWDLNGRVVGYSGRVFQGEKESKYINTMETEIFHKGDLIYNYHRAKDAVRETDTVIIMEGFMDVIRAYTIGIKNVVAMMGTAVTKKQAMLIKRMANNVILCFDGDAAGAKATLSCSNELLSLGVTPKIVRLEKDLDPDDYIKTYGKERFLAKIENPMNVMDFKLSYLKQKKDLSNSIDMAAYVNLMMAELLKIEDPVLKEISLKKISEESHLEFDFLKERLMELEKKEPKENKKVSTMHKPSTNKSKYELAESYLLYYMLRYDEVIDLYQRKVTYMPTERYRFFAREISCYYKENHTMNLADFISFLAGDDQNLEVLKEINLLNLKEEYTKEEIEDYIHAILEYNIDVEIQRLQTEMKKTDDKMEKAKIGEQIVELKKRRDLND